MLNFRCTAENFRSTAYNIGSIYFKRRSKKLNSATFICYLQLLLYFSPVIDKTADLLRRTVLTKENLHLKKFKTDNNECVEQK